MALIFGISFAFAVAEEYSIVSKNYGKMHHQVYYSTSNITKREIDEIAEAAMPTNLLLDSAGKWTAHIRKVNIDYKISLAVTEATFSDEAFLKFIKEERR